MKLNLLFVIMYALTLLAYPIVLIYSKIHRLSISKESINLANLLITDSIGPGV
jgi:hypothetical protein